MTQHAPFPGQPVPQAPVPQPGGYPQPGAPVGGPPMPPGVAPPAPPAPPAAAAPMTYAAAHATYGEAQANAMFAAGQLVEKPAPAAPPGAPAAPPPELPPHLAAALKGAAMGGGYAKGLPPGDYQVVAEKQEVAPIGPEKGRKQWVLFVHVMVESSSNPNVPPGFRGKITRFLESDYDQERALAEVKEIVGQCKGCTTAEQLDAQHPNWYAQLTTNPEFVRGGRLAGSVTTRMKDGVPVKRKDGSIATRDQWQLVPNA